MSTQRPSAFPVPPSFEDALKKLRSLLEMLQEAVAEGALHVPEYAKWQAEPIDYALAHNLLRYKAKNFLLSKGQDARDEELEEGNFETEHLQNNGICINVPGFKIRVLKSSEDGSVPPPGKSLARQNFYKQDQALLDYEEFRNGSAHVQPTWGLIVHWTVNRDYSLQRLSLALPLRETRDGEGRLVVECAFDEPFWTRPPKLNVAPIDQVVQPSDYDIPGIQEEHEEKTGEEPGDE